VPTIAGLISLLNSLLLDRGHAPLGFANPVMYAAARSRPEAFIDSSRGDSRCGRVPSGTGSAAGATAVAGAGSVCCRYGWPAGRGWDAATGLGAPVFDELAHFVLVAAQNGKSAAAATAGGAGGAGVIGADAGGAEDPYLTTPIVVGVGILCLFLALVPGALFAALATWIARGIAAFAGITVFKGDYVDAPPVSTEGRRRKIRERKISIPDFDESGEDEGAGGKFRTPATSAVLD
jgi:hypothetical protein